ncbi:MAG: hypothetical protein KC443_00915 [Anaerolineales bacterium]|nr:hypothetical protein [Anaerolineales bacterium]
MRRWLRVIALIGIGLTVGLGLGLYLGWEAWPIEYTDAVPGILQDSYRRDYAILIAATYAVDNDLSGAERRVNSLGADGRNYFYSVTLDAILRGDNDQDIRQLARLAADLGLDSPALAPYLAGDNAGNTAP